MEHKLRTACSRCNCPDGYIQTRGGQDCVRCLNCDKFLYNAPRTETGRAERTIETVHENVTATKRARILLFDNAHCVFCGSAGTAEHPLHVGHLLSVADGLRLGLTEAEVNCDENLATMCDKCNLGIGKLTVPLRLCYAIWLTRSSSSR